MNLPPIRQVWSALGGPPLSGNRGKAFWRDGDGYNIALNDNKGAWFDFVTGVGGGVIDLVCVVHDDPSRAAAVRWLDDRFGNVAPPDHLTPEERKAKAKAEKKQREEVQRWRDGCILRLEAMQRAGLYAEDWEKVGHAAKRLHRLRTATTAQLTEWFLAQPERQRKEDTAVGRRFQRWWDGICLQYLEAVGRGQI